MGGLDFRRGLAQDEINILHSFRKQEPKVNMPKVEMKRAKFVVNSGLLGQL
jgi:hypothetical protein